MSASEIINLSARELVKAYAAKALSPVEVTEVMLARIEAVNPAINAFHVVRHDRAMSAARISETRWVNGAPQGLLDGVPTAIKDGLMMEGVAVYRGSAANGADQAGPATFNAPCVDRLIEHGAVILGKTTMCDYGMLASGYSSKFGPTRNPWNLDKTSGGSSSGSAAAVAAGIGPVTVGTDIVGSVRNPASFCGLVGHKPSFGRVPYYPQLSPAVCAGPIARDVADAALLLNVLALPDARDGTALAYQDMDYTRELEGALKGLRIGYMKELGFGPQLDDEVRKCVQNGIDALAAGGANVIEISPPFEPQDHQCAERFYQVRARAELDLLSPDVQARAEVISAWTAPARNYTAIDHHRDFTATQMMRAKLLDVIQGVDFLALPTVPVLPYAADNPGLDNGDIFAPWSNTFPFNLTEQPAVSVPCGWSQDGLPVGLQLVGHRYDDVGVLRAAAAFEAALGLARRHIPDRLG